jgi:hypothetical protein
LVGTGLIGTVTYWIQIAATRAGIFDTAHGFKPLGQFDTATVADFAFDLVILE